MPSDELAAIKTIFPESGSPESVIDRVIVQMKPADGKCKSKMTDCDASKTVVLWLPWIGPISCNYWLKIQQSITIGFPNAVPKVVFTSVKAFSGRAKDAISTSKQSSVVYEFTQFCLNPQQFPAHLSCNFWSKRFARYAPGFFSWQKRENRNNAFYLGAFLQTQWFLAFTPSTCEANVQHCIILHLNSLWLPVHP